MAAGRPGARSTTSWWWAAARPGSSCAYWLAEAGWDVAVVEKKVFPREKTCGDGLTPRSVRQLADMGIEGALAGAHRYTGLRAHAFGRVLDLPWPEHPSFPSYGYTITRHDLDGLVDERAVKAGATVLAGHRGRGAHPRRRGGARRAGSLAPRLRGRAGHGQGQRGHPPDPGPLRGGGRRGQLAVRPDPRHARDRDQPMGMALRGYYTSPGHDRTFIESHLDIRDADGKVVPGYGWIFPLGDGRVNVGVGLLSTDKRWKGVNTSHLMDALRAATRRGSGSCPRPRASVRRPAASSPWASPSDPGSGPPPWWWATPAGSINPFNGEGIAYGYETGRLAAASLGEALSGDGVEGLLRYETRLEDAYGLYYRVARAFIRVISRPELMQLCVGTGMHSEPLMSWILRIMANLLRPDETGPAEAAYRALAVIARMSPEAS